MLVLSGRVHQKFVFPGFHTTIQVVSIQSGLVRLGIEAPQEVRVLRQEVPDRVAEWGEEPAAGPPTPLQLGTLVDKRLAISQTGLAELRRRLRSGTAEDVEMILDRLDEDLHLLRRRVRHEVEADASRVGREDAVEEEPECDEYGCLSVPRRSR